MKVINIQDIDIPEDCATYDELAQFADKIAGLAVNYLEVAEPKTGQWIIENKYEDYRMERCSVCGFVANRPYIQDVWHYCPYCGAKMEEEEEPKLCASCPYNPVEAMIRNGGEDVCPDAFKPVAKYCNYNYNCQIRDDDR